MIHGYRVLLAQHLVPASFATVLAWAAEVRETRDRSRGVPPHQRKLDAANRLQALAAPAVEAVTRISHVKLRPYAAITVRCWVQEHDVPPIL